MSTTLSDLSNNEKLKISVLRVTHEYSILDKKIKTTIPTAGKVTHYLKTRTFASSGLEKMTSLSSNLGDDYLSNGKKLQENNFEIAQNDINRPGVIGFYVKKFLKNIPDFLEHHKDILQSDIAKQSEASKIFEELQQPTKSQEDFINSRLDCLYPKTTYSSLNRQKAHDQIDKDIKKYGYKGYLIKTILDTPVIGEQIRDTYTLQHQEKIKQKLLDTKSKQLKRAATSIMQRVSLTHLPPLTKVNTTPPPSTKSHTQQRSQLTL
jgi:hypothetical protein